jgi:hypothetical protein
LNGREGDASERVEGDEVAVDLGGVRESVKKGKKVRIGRGRKSEREEKGTYSGWVME